MAVCSSNWYINALSHFTCSNSMLFSVHEDLYVIIHHLECSRSNTISVFLYQTLHPCNNEKYQIVFPWCSPIGDKKISARSFLGVQRNYLFLQEFSRALEENFQNSRRFPVVQGNYLLFQEFSRALEETLKFP